MRGVFHSYGAVVALALGSLLVVEAPDAFARLGCAIYTFAVTAMFTTSATYHIPQWGPAARNVLRRLDHSAIFILIAGTNTPLAMLGLDAPSRSRLLGIVWAGAAAGVLQTLFFRHAPKALAASLYVALGWAALPYAGQLSAALGSVGVALVVGGGVVYSLGAVVYATRRPDPWPQTVGYHEVFHILVALAALLHYAAVYLVVRSARAPASGRAL